MKSIKEPTVQSTNNIKNNNNRISHEITIESFNTIKPQILRLLEEQPAQGSFFKSMARFWGERSWWLKALILFVITIPLVVAGVYLQMPLLFFVASAFAVVYLSVSSILDTRYNTEVELQNQFKQNTDPMLQFIEGKFNHFRTLVSLLFSELEDADNKNLLLKKQDESSNLQKTQSKTQFDSMGEQLQQLVEQNKNLEKVNYELQQKLQEVNSNNNDRFLTTLITHMNTNPPQYAGNQPYFGANQSFLPTNQSSYIQRNFFEPRQNASPENVGNSFRITNFEG